MTVKCYIWDSHSESRPDSRAASGADFLAPFLARAFLPNQKFHVVPLLPKIFLTSFLSLLWGKKEKKRKGREGKGKERERKRDRGREGGREERKGGKKAFVVYSSRQTLPLTRKESKYQFQERTEMTQVSWDEPGLPPS